MIKVWKNCQDNVGIKKDIKFEHRIIRHNHILWREMFLECCDNTNNSVIITRLSDPRQCECGRLLYGSLFFRLYGNVPNVPELEEEHNRLHMIARSILERTKDSDTRDTVIVSSDRFLGLLDEVYDVIGKKSIRMRRLQPLKPSRM